MMIDLLHQSMNFHLKQNRFVTKNSQLDVYMSSYLSKNYFYLHDSLCHTGIALLKFKIDATSNITDISRSETIPALLASALKKTLQKSEPYWKRGKGERHRGFFNLYCMIIIQNVKPYSMISTLSKEEYSGLTTIRK